MENCFLERMMSKMQKKICYYEGRKGDDIPLIARMICVADAFDAMNSNRVYRQKLPAEKIVEEIEKNKGKQFDPKIADIFLRLLKEGKIK